MSKPKNVHPDRYKTRGSGRQGEEVVQRKHRERLTQEETERERWRQRQQAKEEQHREREQEVEERETVSETRD